MDSKWNNRYILFIIFYAKEAELKLRYFYKKVSYEDMGLMPLEGIVIRMLCYGIGFFFIYAIAILMSEKKIKSCMCLLRAKASIESNFAALR